MINAYSFGSITINEKTYDSDIIIYPDSVNDSWWRKQGHNLCMEDIQEIIDYAPDVLIIGTGNSGMMVVSQKIKEQIRSHDIELIVLPTPHAVKKYNELSKSKKVVGAFHLTC